MRRQAWARILELERFSSLQLRLFSVVIPCYNEQQVLDETIARLLKLADSLVQYRTELVFVDDGSKDRTLDILRAAARKDPRIRIISFARNFGHQIAVTAGIDAAAGDAVALIDADLQDPPELLAKMLDHWEEGYDVVYGLRVSREGEGLFKLATARWFYRLMNRLSETPIPLDTGDFRLMDRKVVDVLRGMPERHRFVRGLVAWVGYNQLPMPYDRKRRLAGTSKYPLRKMLRFATDGIVSFSSRPLKVATNLGILAASLAMLGIVYALLLRMTTSIWVEGWTTLLIAVLFLGGVQLISLGIIGEYIGRIYEEAKGRPLYLVRERIGFETRTEGGQKRPAAQPLSALDAART